MESLEGDVFESLEGECLGGDEVESLEGDEMESWRVMRWRVCWVTRKRFRE